MIAYSLEPGQKEEDLETFVRSGDEQIYLVHEHISDSQVNRVKPEQHFRGKQRVLHRNSLCPCFFSRCDSELVFVFSTTFLIRMTFRTKGPFLVGLEFPVFSRNGQPLLMRARHFHILSAILDLTRGKQKLTSAHK